MGVPSREAICLHVMHRADVRLNKPTTRRCIAHRRRATCHESLRHPVFLGLRKDKPAEEVVKEIAD